MLGVLTIFAAIVAGSSAALAQEPLPAPSPPPPPPFQKLRYDEDYTYLRDPDRYTDFWDTIKYLKLNEDGTWYLSFGGEARERYEYYRNYRWNPASPDTDGYFLQRYLLHADLHMGESVRVFAQFQSSLENGRAGGPRPTDEDRADIHQLFTDLRLWSEGQHDSLTLRVGRQEMLYGSQRLVSVREDPNNRRAFDAARLLARIGDWHVDAFVGRPVEIDRGVFDDWGDDDTTFWGLYATTPLSFIDGANIDFYYLGLNRPNATFVQGTADEQRHSVGARFFGNADAFDYNAEGVFQFGDFGGGSIFAWTLASDIGYTFRDAPLSPRIGLKADIISGDHNQNDASLGTFNALFPRGAYFGEIALIGPANLIDVHPTLEFHPAPELTLSADWDVFWRYSRDDGIYDTAGNVLRPPTGSASFVGHQASIGLQWAADRHATLNAVYSHFFAGDFLRQSGPSADVDFVAIWLTYRF